MTIDAVPDGSAGGTDPAPDPRGIWGLLEQRFGLVSLRPRLADDVRLRHIGDDWELVQVSSRRVLPLGDDEVAIVRRFDGAQSIAEIIVAGIGAGRLSVEPVLSLVDRLVRSEMLAQYPPDLYRQVDQPPRPAVDRGPRAVERADGSDSHRSRRRGARARPRSPSASGSCGAWPCWLRST